MRLLTRFLTLCVVVSIALFTGCTEPEAIVTYEVPKTDSLQLEPNSQRPSSDADSTAKTPKRMLAAMILHEGASWSFKAFAAPEDFPDDAAKEFARFVSTLTFTDRPNWQLSDRWTERPGGGMRLATLQLEGLEFTVIRLPVRSPEDSYLLSNVNRWRDQVGLAGISQAEFASTTQSLATQDELKATIVDITGMAGSKPMRPMAGLGPMQGTPRDEKPESDSKRPTGFSATTPSGWKESKPGMMQKAVYLIEADGKTAKASVSTAGGDVLQNINRWRGQVGLSPLASRDDGDIKTQTISSQPSLYCEMHGDDQSIVVAMTPADKPTWFFKLMGDPDVVRAETETFQTFLKSVNLP